MLCALREERLVALRGKRYYLSHGLVGADTPLGRQSARGRLIGLHVTTIDTPFFSALTHAAQKSADALGYRLLTAESGYDSAREREILNTFEDDNDFSENDFDVNTDTDAGYFADQKLTKADREAGIVRKAEFVTPKGEIGQPTSAPQEEDAPHDLGSSDQD